MVVSTASPSVSAAVSLPRNKLVAVKQLRKLQAKTPRAQILGVFLWLFASVCSAECGLPQGQAVAVAKVIDGDTLRLADGRNLRVLGINAPEVAHGNEPGQALGVEATQAARAFVGASANRVWLGFEVQTKDHYGRSLAHIYNAKGQALSAALLRQGLAFAAPVAPNSRQAGCLFDIQQQARSRQLGVWSDPAWQLRQSRSLTARDSGYLRAQGKIEKVSLTKREAWLDLEGGLTLRVARQDWLAFNYRAEEWRDLTGRSVEVQGWAALRKSGKAGRKPLLMALSSPYSWKLSAN